MEQIKKDDGRPSHRCQSRLTSGIRPKHSLAQCEKRKISKTDDNQQELLKLPIELLEEITKSLDVLGFCAFGVVCKRGWEIYASYKEKFIKSQAPMAILISSHAKRACYLYDMGNGNMKKVMLLNLVGKHFVGSSAGYMIIQDLMCRISIMNPLSGHHLDFLSPSFALEGRTLYDPIILIPTLSFRSYFILAISLRKDEIHIFNSRSGGWIIAPYRGKHWVDMEVFKDQIYILSRKTLLGKININASYYEVDWLTVRNTPMVNYKNLKLVASDNQLLMVDFVPGEYLNIFKMDFDSMEWVKLDNLDDQTLFFSKEWGSSIRKLENWGGQKNCVYYLDTLSSMCCIYSMEAKLIGEFRPMGNSTSSKLQLNGWYYPHQCLKVDHPLEDLEI